MQILENGSVTSPQGFRAAGVTGGLKVTGKPDLALVVSDTPAVVAGVFTTNQVHAYNVDRNRAVLAQGGTARAILVNSGNANTATGEQGRRDTDETAELVAQLLSLRPEEVFTNSTGVIGVPLDMPRIRAGIQAAVAALAPDGGLDAAVAIMTTDTRPKHIAVQVDVGGRSVTIGGMAKGAGMIHPNMATMLAYVTTDAAIAPELLQAATKRAADLSFNVITVDGDTSTSDTCLVLANGMAGLPSPEIGGGVGRGGRPRWESAVDPGCADFEAAFQHVFQHLAREIARDGEGATKLLTVTVRGAPTEAEARTVARTVAGSNLFKAAVFGCDPNWGRIAAAAGRAGVSFDPHRLDVTMNGLALLRAGEPLPFDRAAAVAGLKEATEVTVEVGLNAGNASATAWGCDLTFDYVKINAEYFT
jgi:glutamate N-acetyltransferase/amino-acid N-acetyltransferase